MFEITPEMQAEWDLNGDPKATDEDIARLEAHIGAELPSEYAEFIRTYGFVAFSMDMNDGFDAAYEEGTGTVTRRGSIAYLMDPDRIVLTHRTAAREAPDEGYPMFPANFLPVAGDVGEGLVLLELSPKSGQVWYWPQRDARWGEPGNTSLGFVAVNFEAFINGLKPYDAP